MPFGYSAPVRATATDPSGARKRRLANALAGGTSVTGNNRALRADLKGDEYVDIVTTKDAKILFRARHATYGEVKMTVGNVTGGQLSTSNGSITTFIADNNGVSWKYRTNGIGTNWSISNNDTLIEATSGGVTFTLDGFAAGQLQDGTWLTFIDESGDVAASGAIEIAPDSGESHTINGSPLSVFIEEPFGGCHLIFDGVSNWTAFYLNPMATNGGGIGFQAAINAYSTSTTLGRTQYTIPVSTTTADVTITLPPAADHKGRVYNIKKYTSDSNKVIIDGDGSETIDGSTTIELLNQYDSVTIQSDGSRWHIL